MSSVTEQPSKPPLRPARRSLPSAPRVPAALPFPEAHLFPLVGGPAEDVVVDADGRHLLVGVDDGGILRIDPATGAFRRIADTGGRPLGLLSARDGSLLVCDADRGLLRITDLPEPGDASTGAPAGTGTVTVLVAEADGVPLRFCSNVTEEADGTLWITQSSTRFSFPQYMGAVLEHRGSGRLLRRDPDGTVTVVADEVDFPNGIALAPDGQSVFMVETTTYSVVRRWIRGPRAGEIDRPVTNHAGFPDNLSEFRAGSDGPYTTGNAVGLRAWFADAQQRSAPLDLLGRLPGVIASAAWALPDALLPQPAGVVQATAVDADGATVRTVRGTWPGFSNATGAVELDGILYLVSKDHAALLAVPLG